MYKTLFPSPLGNLLIHSDGQALTGIWLEGQKYYAATANPLALVKDDLDLFDRVRDWLDRYFAGQRPGHDEVPLAPRGSPFRQAVWKILLDIPYGEVLTYGMIADRISALPGRPKTSARAVGGAVGHNPVSIMIPCHRVIGSGGDLTGFASGLEVKTWLLMHEGHRVQDLKLQASNS